MKGKKQDPNGPRLFFPPLLAFLTIEISLLFPGITYSPGMVGMFTRFEALLTPLQMEKMRQSIATMTVNPVWMVLLQGLIAGFTINAVAGFGEELGWRGYLCKYPIARKSQDTCVHKSAILKLLSFNIYGIPKKLV